MSGLSVLRLRDFRLLYAGQSVSIFGDAIATMAITFAVLDLTDSAAVLAVVMVGGRLPTILLALVGGAAGDRFSRRSIMLSADLVRLAVQLFLGVLLVAGGAELWMIFIGQLLAGTASAFFLPASQGLVTSLVPAGRLAEANSLLGISRSTAAILALTSSAVLISTVGSGWAVVVDALTFAVSACLLYRLPATVASRPLERRESLLASIGAGLVAVRERPWLRVSILYEALANMIMVTPLLVLGPVIAEQHLGGATGWAAITVAFAAGGVAGGIVAMRWRPARPMAAALLFSFVGLPLMLLMSVSAPIVVLAAAALASGVEQTVFVVLFDTAVQRNVPATVISRVSSVILLAGLVPVPVGMALSGWLADVVGPSRVLAEAWLVAVLITVAALLAPGVWSLRQKTTQLDAEVPA